MAEVPEFFEYLAREGSGATLYPFSYDSKDKVFLIADKSLPLDSFDPHDYSHSDLGLSAMKV
ncbi:MAG TPA: hypothetical protein VMR34_02680 [Candidatus Saccharimonadales bacterium]|nr:hypothetical protein [Candidatus Saccharimonadales bacterium]